MRGPDRVRARDDAGADRPPPGRVARLVRAFVVVMGGLLLGGLGYAALVLGQDGGETARTTPRFDPPVLAGQNVPGACSGGFYARHDRTIVLTVVEHCARPGAALRDGSGRLIGIFGPRAQLPGCPAGRACAPSDFVALELAPDRIPWGHLDLVDLGAGGYRRITPDLRPLSCADIAVGGRVETNGRERYRSGRVVGVAPYDRPGDIIFPCMVRTDLAVRIGDSGGAVFVDGRPAGVVSRNLDGRLGFTPLAEGLAALGLTLCDSADCGLTPADVVQPTG